MRGLTQWVTRVVKKVDYRKVISGHYLWHMERTIAARGCFWEATEGWTCIKQDLRTRCGSLADTRSQFPTWSKSYKTGCLFSHWTASFMIDGCCFLDPSPSAAAIFKTTAEQCTKRLHRNRCPQNKPALFPLVVSLQLHSASTTQHAVDLQKQLPLTTAHTGTCSITPTCKLARSFPLHTITKRQDQIDFPVAAPPASAPRRSGNNSTKPISSNNVSPKPTARPRNNEIARRWHTML